MVLVPRRREAPTRSAPVSSTLSLNSAAAVAIGDEARMIEPAEGATDDGMVFPSYVAFDATGRMACAGVQAKRQYQSAADLVREIGLPPLTLCHLIAGQNLPAIPLAAYYRIARWLQMPLWNALLLAGVGPDLAALVRFGMELRGYRVPSTEDQERTARAIGISVAVFRRAQLEVLVVPQAGIEFDDMPAAVLGYNSAYSLLPRIASGQLATS